jgi:hypothetical protein
MCPRSGCSRKCCPRARLRSSSRLGSASFGPLAWRARPVACGSCSRPVTCSESHGVLPIAATVSSNEKFAGRQAEKTFSAEERNTQRQVLYHEPRVQGAYQHGAVRRSPIESFVFSAHDSFVYMSQSTASAPDPQSIAAPSNIIASYRLAVLISFFTPSTIDLIPS